MARWISGIVLAALVTALLLFGTALHLQLVVLVVALVACWEFLNLVGLKSLILKFVAEALVVTGLCMMWFCPPSLHLYFYFFMVLFFGFVLQFSGTDESSQKIVRVSYFVLAVFYVVTLFGMLGLLAKVEHSMFWLFYTVACTFGGDTGAFMAGKSFGKHKLAPSISPGKTIEGVVGGMMLAAIMGFGVRQIFWPELSISLTLGLAVMLALIGVVGDLSESLLKRGFGVKDSGNVIPGHGGILDRVDGLLFTVPVTFLVSQCTSLVG